MNRRDRDGEEIEIDVVRSDSAEDGDDSVDDGDDLVEDNDGLVEDRDDFLEGGNDIVDTDDGHHSPQLSRTADSDLADELGRIAIRSTPEGHVEARVSALESEDETTLRLSVVLPHGRTASFVLEKPIPWSEEFLLARIVDRLGYDAASIDHVVGETVYMTRTDVGTVEETGGGFRKPYRLAADLLRTTLGGRFDGRETRPTWRLVDPRERPDPDEATRPDDTTVPVAVVAVILGTIAAAVGAIVGTTGSLAITAAAVGYTLPGLLVMLVGLFVLHSRAKRPQ